MYNIAAHITAHVALHSYFIFLRGFSGCIIACTFCMYLFLQ